MKESDLRKLKVLKLIVEQYIQSGDPVGSKSIAFQFESAVSSATVRNDMALLERMGYLSQPHTSAGRIPSSLGYRHYISHLMRREPLSDLDREIIDSRIVRGDLNPRTLIANAADLLVKLTDCAVVTTMSETGYAIITRVEAFHTGRRLYAIMVSSSGGAVENRVCRLDCDLPPEQLEFFLRLVRDNLVGLRIDELTDEKLVELGLALRSKSMALAPLLYGVYDITSELRRRRVEIMNETSLLRKGVFRPDQYTDLINSQDQLGSLLEAHKTDVSVLFGKQDSPYAVEGSAMIIAPYRQGSRAMGSIGIIGPLRMDYGRILPFTEYLTDTVTRLLTEGMDDDRTKPSRMNRGPTDLAPAER